MSNILAFDFGLARIGVAVGQPVTRTASPLPILPAKDGQPNWLKVEQLIREWKPQLLVVGEPLNMDGSEQEITHRARKFANRLHGRFGLKVELVDERLTSRAAREELFEQGGYRQIQKAPLDSIAAVHILEGWFARQQG